MTEECKRGSWRRPRRWQKILIKFVLIKINDRRCLIEFELGIVKNIVQSLIHRIVNVLVIKVIALNRRRSLIVVILLIRREIFVTTFATCWPAVIIIVRSME